VTSETTTVGCHNAFRIAKDFSHSKSFFISQRKFELALVFLDSREHTVHTVVEGSADEYPDVAQALVGR
jgi:hypothetical protein